MVTDRSPQFIAQEIIREQLYHQLGKELPYAAAVQVESWTERKGELAIGAVIVVERDVAEADRRRQGRRAGSASSGSRRASRSPSRSASRCTCRCSSRFSTNGAAEAELRKLGYGGESK